MSVAVAFAEDVVVPEQDYLAGQPVPKSLFPTNSSSPPRHQTPAAGSSAVVVAASSLLQLLYPSMLPWMVPQGSQQYCGQILHAHGAGAAASPRTCSIWSGRGFSSWGARAYTASFAQSVSARPTGHLSSTFNPPTPSCWKHPSW
jgi:hypothetical protein